MTIARGAGDLYRVSHSPSSMMMYSHLLSPTKKVFTTKAPLLSAPLIKYPERLFSSTIAKSSLDSALQTSLSDLLTKSTTFCALADLLLVDHSSVTPKFSPYSSSSSQLPGENTLAPNVPSSDSRFPRSSSAAWLNCGPSTQDTISVWLFSTRVWTVKTALTRPTMVLQRNCLSPFMYRSIASSMSPSSPSFGHVSIWYTGMKRMKPNTDGVLAVCTSVSRLVVLGSPVCRHFDMLAFLAGLADRSNSIALSLPTTGLKKCTGKKACGYLLPPTLHGPPAGWSAGPGDPDAELLFLL
mmetsp:Transcript_47969/g.119932  ORF Transcript_47969/g.119932 Transcript_47969/m.119932 type:complete len:297 (+) Transcript_47969:498-1388(+)